MDFNLFRKLLRMKMRRLFSVMHYLHDILLHHFLEFSTVR